MMNSTIIIIYIKNTFRKDINKSQTFHEYGTQNVNILATEFSRKLMVKIVTSCLVIGSSKAHYVTNF